eukprot:gene36831-48031_t
MAVTTVAQFAAELKRPAATLLEQLQSAGVAKKSQDDALTESDKERLLDFLRNSHGTAGADRKKITLVKKSTSEIKQADATGKARTIQVEVRKKRTFIRREDGPEGAAEAPEPLVPHLPLIDEAELARREEEARHQAELLRRQEEELVERRRQREALEALAREAAAQAAIQKAAELKAAEAAAEKARLAAPESLAQEASESAAARAQEAAARAEAVAKSQEDERASAAAAAKARADEDVARAADLGDRRRKAEAEAAAIRLMMSAPAKKPAPPPKKPEEVKPAVKPGAVEAAKTGLKGTLHKPAAGTTVAKPARPGAPGAPGTSAPAGAGKEVKSAKLSSSW